MRGASSKKVPFITNFVEGLALEALQAASRTYYEMSRYFETHHRDMVQTPNLYALLKDMTDDGLLYQDAEGRLHLTPRAECGLTTGYEPPQLMSLTKGFRPDSLDPTKYHLMSALGDSGDEWSPANFIRSYCHVHCLHYCRAPGVQHCLCHRKILPVVEVCPPEGYDPD